MLLMIKDDIKNGSARNDKGMNKMATDIIEVLNAVKSWISKHKYIMYNKNGQRKDAHNKNKENSTKDQENDQKMVTQNENQLNSNKDKENEEKEDRSFIELILF